MKDLPDAEDINYWKTSGSGPDTWLERASKLIEGLGGTVWTHAFGKDDQGHSAYVMQFEIESDQFKIFWPVLPSRTKNEKNELAAKRQAATLLFYDVKARCLTALILGSRATFFQFLMLPDGRTAASASIPELMKDIPKVLSGFSQPQITEEN